MEKSIHLGLFILTFFNFSFFAFSKELEESEQNYTIISATFDKGIDANKYVIEGKVKDLNSLEILKNIEIFYGSGDLIKTVSKNGYFKLTLNVKAKQLLFRTSELNRTDIANFEAKTQYRYNLIVYINQNEEPYFNLTEKPVIYAYSELDLDLILNLKPQGKLKFTYPIISKSNTWKMKLINNHFCDGKGTEYPYLFWDSEQKDIQISKNENTINGVILKKEHVVTYLDSILNAVGFNSQEKTDFVTYWGPRLVEKNFCFVQFQTQKECLQFADYEISPKPDNFNRFYILFSSFEYFPNNFKVSSQNINSFKRDDFNILEWGGMEISNETLNQIL